MPGRRSTWCTGGGNYGWNVTEGFSCFSPSRGCDETDLEQPVVDYGRQFGCSVTGGYVYRGAAFPSLRGAYVYADFCSGIVWGLQRDGPDVTFNEIVAETDLNISSFGEDEGGELYATAFDGLVYRVRPAG